jgi:hypothetical protein
MKKVVLGMGVAALLAGAGLASAQSAKMPAEDMPAAESTTPSDNTRVAAADISAATFKKLDADSDNRISAIEAANDTNVAAGFTKADADKDGYLSKDEFKKLKVSDQSAPQSSSDPSMSTDTPTTDPQTTVPPQ